MSKKTESSLKSLRGSDVQRLHSLLKGCFSFDEGLEASAERARERAFAVHHRPELFKYWYLRSQVSKRYQKGTVSAQARKLAAVDAFRLSEDECRLSNERLYDLWNRPSAARYWAVFKRARRIVSEILGEYHADDLPYACTFSGGASTELRRSESAAPIKWDKGSHITRDALPYAVAFAQWAGPIKEWRFVVVPGNTVFTVPKNYKRDRTCAKEPTWNMFFQKGLGLLIRRQLARNVGLLHPDAQVTHQRLAQEASLSGELATLDLSAASDSVSNALVELLVPQDWAKVLFALRSPVGKLPDGGQITYEKISSMGNGYTFELETLLFYALVRAVCGKEGRVSVYGDDIICPSAHARQVAEVLRFAGFGLNLEKSFSTGHFRESCGGHYFRGVDVKPFYVQQMPVTLGQVINLHNDIVQYHRGMPRNERLLRVAKECRRLVPRSFWGPVGTAGAIWSEWDEACPYFVGKPGRNRPIQSGFRGEVKLIPPSYQHWRVRTVRYEVVKQRHDYFAGSLLATLWGVSPTELRSPVTLRRLTLRELALSLRHIDEVSDADFAYAMRREIAGWTSVGVGLQWPKLPVRIA